MAYRNIVLIGFMGTGKSGVGKLLSNRLRRPLVDVDQRIERQEKKKIWEIFDQDGESYFRAAEKKEILRVAGMQGAVITTGGGAVIDPENVAGLKQNGFLVALLAEPETIYARVKDSVHRPLLRVTDPLAEIRRLLEIRRPLYQCADHFFHTDGKKVSQVALEIMDALREKLETEFRPGENGNNHKADA